MCTGIVKLNKKEIAEVSGGGWAVFLAEIVCVYVFAERFLEQRRVFKVFESTEARLARYVMENRQFLLKKFKTVGVVMGIFTMSRLIFNTIGDYVESYWEKD